MPEIVIILVAVAILLALAVKVVARLDYQADHPSVEAREKRLLDRYASTDMDVETYQTELAKLEKEKGYG